MGTCVSEVTQILQRFFHCLKKFYYSSWLMTFASWNSPQLFHNFNGNGCLAPILVLEDLKDIICSVRRKANVSQTPLNIFQGLWGAPLFPLVMNLFWSSHHLPQVAEDKLICFHFDPCLRGGGSFTLSLLPEAVLSFDFLWRCSTGLLFIFPHTPLMQASTLSFPALTFLASMMSLSDFSCLSSPGSDCHHQALPQFALLSQVEKKHQVEFRLVSHTHTSGITITDWQPIVLTAFLPSLTTSSCFFVETATFLPTGEPLIGFHWIFLCFWPCEIYIKNK